MSVKKLALFGGSFNPVSLAHLQIVKYFVERDFEKVLLIPCGFREDKNLFASNENWIQMLQLASKDYFGKTLPVVNSSKDG